MADPKDETRQQEEQAHVPAPEGEMELAEHETESVAGGSLSFTAERVAGGNLSLTAERVPVSRLKVSRVCGMLGGPGAPTPVSAEPVCKCMGMAQDPKTLLPE
jgi:hypothetical protein